MTTTWWVDASAGASSDMLLGALLDLAPDLLPAAQSAVDEVLMRLNAPGAVTVRPERVRRSGLAATRAIVLCAVDQPRRTWRDLEPALADRPAAHEVFHRLAVAEAAVHNTAVADVHFHEVGALDAVADIVAVTTLRQVLAPQRITVSPVCVGSGQAQTEHGAIPVPVPAVVELLAHAGGPSFGGALAHEACTPTGAALLAHLADDWGPQPPMTVSDCGTGAGGRDTAGQANVLRILRGTTGGADEQVVVVEATIDDLDPRLYPEVTDQVRRAGALETWLTPVMMKYGRPATTVTALVPFGAVAAVEAAMLEHSTTFGVRRFPVHRTVLQRAWVPVVVAGQTVRVKVGHRHTRVLTVQPEYADCEVAARVLAVPVREVLVAAAGAARDRGLHAGTRWNPGG